MARLQKDSVQKGQQMSKKKKLGTIKFDDVKLGEAEDIEQEFIESPHFKQVSASDDAVEFEADMTPESTAMVKGLIEQGNQEYRERIETLTRMKNKFVMTDKELDSIDFCIGLLKMQVASGEKVLKSISEKIKGTTS